MVGLDERLERSAMRELLDATALVRAELIRAIYGFFNASSAREMTAASI